MMKALNALGAIGNTPVGAIQLAEELGKGKTVVTIAVDTGLKYLTGNLFL